MIGNQMINDRSSVAYSSTINLPQINSDNDNNVRARSLEKTLIVNANVRSRARTRSAKPVLLQERHSSTVQYDDTRSC